MVSTVLWQSEMSLKASGKFGKLLKTFRGFW